MSRSIQSQNTQQVTQRDQQAQDLLSGIEAECIQIVTRSQSGVNWAQEALFAYHAMLSNETLMRCAINNKLSFKLAMQQDAADRSDRADAQSHRKDGLPGSPPGQGDR